jgi:predicted kinase
MKIVFKPHTVVILVGPTGCGKSTFADSVVQELGGLITTRILSSDGYRNQLLGLGADQDSHSRNMLEVSRQAFSLLMAELNAFTQFPVSTSLIIVDTRGFDKGFRDEVIGVARNNGYNVDCVCFDYKNAKDYITHVPEHRQQVSLIDVRRFRTKCLPELGRKDFDQFIRVRDPSFQVDLDINLEGILSSTASPYYLVEAGQGVAVISDTHECVDQLKSLLSKLPPHVNQVVHVGDYLDKGENTAEMIEFMYDLVCNKGHIMVIGNHESYVYHRLTGSIEPAPKDIEDTYFTSIQTLLSSKELQDKFFRIYGMSVPFIKLSASPADGLTVAFRTTYITHAPCDTKYLGKFNERARRSQRNLYIKNREGDERDEMKFIFNQASAIEPLHIFGHMAHQGNLVYKNKIFLDTGCVHGGYLTACVITDGAFDFIQVPGVNKMPKDLSKEISQPKIVKKPFNINDYSLSPDDQKFLRRTMTNGVKFISGTMAPSPSSDGVLEPLSSAFDYYRKRGVEAVVLQPKYMGSRCQFYLNFEEKEKSFAVSRNGYVIRHVAGLPQLVQEWAEKSKATLGIKEDAKSVILDGELLPWSALGKSLIEKEFYSYASLVHDELSVLSEDSVFQEFTIGIKHDLAGRVNDLGVFVETLGLYAVNSPLEFKAFNILSVDDVPYENFSGVAFGKINEAPQCVVDLVNPHQPMGGNDLIHAEEFFRKLTVEEGMEGVVVKPVGVDMKGLISIPEYMKVRNEKYLTLVYGYDYKRRYKQMVDQKDVTSKVRISIAESNLGRQMLAASEQDRPEFIIKMIAELNQEKTLDPRL